MKPLNENVLWCFKAAALSCADNQGRDTGVERRSQAALMHDRMKKVYSMGHNILQRSIKTAL